MSCNKNQLNQILMLDKITAIYCLVDDLLKGVNHLEDSRRKVSDAEIITTAIVSAKYFGGHYFHAIHYMKEMRLIPRMLDKSRFCRRVHKIGILIYGLFMQVGFILKEVCCTMEYVIDSFPVSVCDNMRISRCKLIRGKQWRGYIASMHRYFFGVKVQLLVTKTGVPVEFCFVPGSEGDPRALEKMPFSILPESEVYGDNGFTSYEMEDLLLEQELIQLKIQRRTNTVNRKDSVCAAYIKEMMRKQIETTISTIKALFPRRIHAVTFEGFLLKVMLFIFAIQINKFTN